MNKYHFPHCFLSLSCFLLTFFALCSCSHHQAADPEKIRVGATAGLLVGREKLVSHIDQVVSDPALGSSSVGIKIVRLTDRVVLFEKNADKLFHPASTLKLFIAGEALKVLGPEYRFVTSLALSPGSLKNQTLNGDIFLIGSGDPSLHTSDLAEMAIKLYRRGVREIRGNVICDATLFDDIHYGSGWMWDDQPYKDFAPISALSVNRNTVEVTVSPAEKTGEPPLVTLFPSTAFLQINNEAETSEGTFTGAEKDERWEPLSVLRRWRDQVNIIDIKGQTDKSSPEQKYKMNIYGPALYTGTLFKEACEKTGIRVMGTVQTGEMPESAELISTHHSAPLATLIMEMNKESHNLDAELLLKAVGGRQKGLPGSAGKGIAVLQESVSSWGVGSVSFRFADGSGVSRYNLLSPNVLMTLLERTYEDFSIRHEFVASLPIAGIDGSLKDRMHGFSAQGVVHAKTGSLSGVSALAGFAESYDGQVLAFVIMMEHFIGTEKNHTGAQDLICDMLCRFTERR